MNDEKVRTRFAPSPTGMLHLGNANTAVFNWLIARSRGGTVVLRVEDTDTERSKEEYERKLFDALKWLGIDWDEGPDVGGPFGPYRQSERMDVYEEKIKGLLESGHLYRCFCPKEQLQAEREEAQKKKKDPRYSRRCRELAESEINEKIAAGTPFSLRFRAPDGEEIVFNDLIRGPISFNSSELDDFIVVRSNGTPIFLLSNAIDDMMMEISHVVRGEDHISNTPKQILIARALGCDRLPEYLHTPIILGPDRSKLSKRHGAVSVGQFREEGYLPEAMVNYLAFLGWNPKDDREIFSLEQLAEEFTVEAMSKTPSVFDYKRIHYLSGEWMQRIERSRVAALCTDYLIERGFITSDEAREKKDWLDRIIAEVVGRLKIISDVVGYTDFFFTDEFAYDEKGAGKFFKGGETASMLEDMAEILPELEPFDTENIESAVRKYMEVKELGAKKVIHPLRLALTGKTIGPGLFETVVLLGPERVGRRLRRAVEFIKAK
ncbi:MAG: glutamate--tRNA ligase [bacterium]